VLANAAMGYYGWQLMTLSKSTLGVPDLKGKKVAITSAGSGSDLLALWTQQDKKIEFTRVPVGGGGLVPNLLAGNVEAAVVYSPLSFQISKSGEARTILDFSKEVPPNLAAGWIALDKYVQDKPQMVQKTLNALYGALAFMRALCRQWPASTPSGFSIGMTATWKSFRNMRAMSLSPQSSSTNLMSASDPVVSGGCCRPMMEMWRSAFGSPMSSRQSFCPCTELPNSDTLTYGSRATVRAHSHISCVDTGSCAATQSGCGPTSSRSMASFLSVD
jgi:hypothetical protein